MAAFDYAQLVDQLTQFGLYQFILPLLLIFVILYAVLTKSKFFDNKSLNAVLALLISVFITLFLTSVEGVGQFFALFLGKMSVLMVVLVIILLVYVFVSGVK